MSWRKRFCENYSDTKHRSSSFHSRSGIRVTKTGRKSMQIRNMFRCLFASDCLLSSLTHARVLWRTIPSTTARQNSIISHGDNERFVDRSIRIEEITCFFVFMCGTLDLESSTHWPSSARRDQVQANPSFVNFSPDRQDFILFQAFYSLFCILITTL